MEIKDIKDLMAQFDDSSLKEFTYQTKEESKSALVIPYFLSKAL